MSGKQDNLVYSARAALGLSQKALARMAGVGMRTIQRIEAGEGASQRNRNKVSAALGVRDEDHEGVFGQPDKRAAAREFLKKRGVTLLPVPPPPARVVPNGNHGDVVAVVTDAFSGETKRLSGPEVAAIVGALLDESYVLEEDGEPGCPCTERMLDVFGEILNHQVERECHEATIESNMGGEA